MQSAASCKPPTRTEPATLACPVWELNWQIFTAWDDAQPHEPPRTGFPVPNLHVIIAGIHERPWYFKHYYFILPLKGIYIYTIS